MPQSWRSNRVISMKETETDRDDELPTGREARKKVGHRLNIRDYTAFFIASLQTIFLPLIIIMATLLVLTSLLAHFF